MEPAAAIFTIHVHTHPKQGGGSTGVLISP